MKENKIVKIILLFLMFNYSYPQQQDRNIYICTAADHKFFDKLLNFIGSLYLVNYDQVEAIAVFDLGMKAHQRKHINSIQKVTVHDIERTNPDLLKPFYTRPGNGKPVPGWYAWKPVCIKQALEMYPYVLWLDAGTTILNPIDDIFKHIIQNGYFFKAIVCHDIRWMTTQFIIEKFNLQSDEHKWILDSTTKGMAGGIIGLSRKLKDSFLMPLYELSKDLRYFRDDGTTPNGFGTGRHDQPLWSIQAQLQGLKIQDHINGEFVPLNIDNKEKIIHLVYNQRLVKPETIFLGQSSLANLNYYKKFIKYDIGVIKKEIVCVKKNNTY